MKLDCEIARDLLCGYTEEMLSEYSRELVRGHLLGCADCRNRLQILQNGDPAPVDVDRYRQSLKRKVAARMWLPVLTVVLLVLTVACGIWICATIPVWFSYEEAVLDVKAGTDMIAVTVTDHTATMYSVTGTAPNGQKVGGVYFMGYRNLLLYAGRENHIAFLKNTLQGGSLWYRGDVTGDQDTLLLGSGDEDLNSAILQAKEKGVDKPSNPVLIYVLGVSVVMGSLFLLLGWLLRKKVKGLKRFSAGLMCFCSAVSSLFVTGGHLVCTDLPIFGPNGYLSTLLAVFIMTFLLWGTVICAVRTCIMNNK